MAFNLVVLVGNLVSDPELKTTTNGTSVTSFRIAVQRRVQEGTDFLDIVAWRKTAEFIAKYFKKGNPILVRGSVQIRTWTTPDNQKRYATEVVADEVSFVGKKENASQANAPSYGAPTGKFEEVADDEELPF